MIYNRTIEFEGLLKPERKRVDTSSMIIKPNTI